MNFLATSQDIKNVISYMIVELGFTIYESYSEYDKPIKRILAGFETSELEDKHGDILTIGWHDEFNSPPDFEIIQSKNTELFIERTTVNNLAGIQIHKQRLMDNGCLYPANLNHWSEKGAKQRAFATAESLDAVNWVALKSKSSKIKRHIRAKMSVAKLNTIPILPDAFDKFLKGDFLLWDFSVAIEPGSKLIELK